MNLFPSPIGELHFSMDEDENTATTTQEVSVPYRGATFLNAFSMVSPYGVMPRFRPLSGSYISQSYPKLIILSYIYVSVPYRGATFLNIRGLPVMNVVLFPSPIGELHFSIRVFITGVKETTVSVPYRGATFLNRILISQVS